MKKRGNILLLVALILSLCLSILFIPFFGTGDMRYFVKTSAVTNYFGLRGGYVAFNLNYPPLASVFLWATGLISRTNFPEIWLHILPTIEDIHNSHIPIKIGLVLVLYLFAGLSFLYEKKERNEPFFKSLGISTFIFLNPALILSTTVLGYVDILLAPTLILSYYFFEKRKYFLSGISYAVSFMTKLFPIFLFPLFFAYFVNLTAKKIKIKIDFKNLISFISGIALVLAGILSFYDTKTIFQIVKASNQHTQWLSNNALNFNWILRELFSPENTAPEPLVLVLKSVFITILILFSFKILFEKKNVKQLLESAVFVMTGYFIFYPGVHENHLIPALILAIIFYVFKPIKEVKQILLSLSFFVFINLFLFYGVGGKIIGNKEFLIAPRTYFPKTIHTIYLIMSTLITMWFFKILVVKLQPVVKKLKVIVNSFYELLA